MNNSVVKISREHAFCDVEISAGPTSAASDLDIHNVIAELRIAQRARKALEDQEELLKARVKAYMGDKEELYDLDGTVAVTWKRGKDVQKLDEKALKEHFYDAWYTCVSTVPGVKRFLVK